MYKKFISFLFLFFLFFYSLAFSIENKIVLKVNNRIITTVDIYNEANYLKALNPNLNDLDQNKIIEIAKKSLVRETIKSIEILKYDMRGIDQEYLENLIKSIYTNIGIKNKEEFINYINTFGISLKIIKKKLSSEIRWNQLIYNKFFSKLKIDKNEIKKKIQASKQKSISYLLYEILYNVDQNIKSKELFQKIKKSILENGFENTATIYSITETAKTGGNLGWINENTINKKILNKISNLKIGQHTNPIITPGGFLILKIKDQKEIEKEINIENELIIRTRYLQNQHLNQYSNIYFNKIKRDILINEN
ncbi:peptidylprolyl isomerase [Candidatus Pelagibacter sp.]|nr:peptidylprolyl isomerase [Candidatus Pelagibacter sp.]